ncbi:serine/threonine-protein kinase [Atopobium fossor]|uniref:serine/threonine-protein kinase n=1 Tax=Atopobium fossor TaxID=39487 RepID=UPI000411214D|nr:serine/threonine-protein kinase [Atopobium fossor]
MHDQPYTHTILRRAALEPEDSASELLLGRYRILETRAHGGFGKVEICWDTRLQRRVAIKCLPLSTVDGLQASTSTMQEALMEARTASMLAHPNIVTMYDFEWDGSYAYLVMEYIDGVNLAELLARVEGGTLTADECAHMLDGVASALAFAHENGVLHLDIKPANIMFDHTGTPKLTDFGMATLASAAGFADARGGTIGYMPPEQIDGELVDERCDLFALVVCLMQALTGTNPYLAPTAQASAKLIYKGADDYLTQLRLDYGPQVYDEFVRALAPDAINRTSSIEKFVTVVTDLLGDSVQGKASLAELLEQVTNDEMPGAVMHGRPLTLTERAPWLAPVLSRTIAAVFSFQIARFAAPSLGLANSGIELAIVCVITGLSAALPNFGSALLLTLCFIAMCAASSAMSYSLFGLALVALFIPVVWWIFIGRKQGIASITLLLPTLISTAFAGVNLSATYLTPTYAALTTAVGWIFSQYADVARISGLSLDSVGLLFQRWMWHPATLLELVGFSIAAFVASLLVNRGGKLFGILGHTIGFALILATLFVRIRVENGGIWASPPMLSMFVAVILFGLSCLITVIFQTPGTPLEVE